MGQTETTLQARLNQMIKAVDGRKKAIAETSDEVPTNNTDISHEDPRIALQRCLIAMEIIRKACPMKSDSQYESTDEAN